MYPEDYFTSTTMWIARTISLRITFIRMLQRSSVHISQKYQQQWHNFTEWCVEAVEGCTSYQILSLGSRLFFRDHNTNLPWRSVILFIVFRSIENGISDSIFGQGMVFYPAANDRAGQPVTWRDQTIKSVIQLLFKLGRRIKYFAQNSVTATHLSGRYDLRSERPWNEGVKRNPLMKLCISTIMY